MLVPYQFFAADHLCWAEPGFLAAHPFSYAVLTDGTVHVSGRVG